MSSRDSTDRAARLRDIGGRPLPAPETTPMTALSLLQQILLITDGTVTHILEAYAGERMRVAKLSQGIGPATTSIPELDIAPGDEVMQRRILLQGSRSGTSFLYAESIIIPSRLPASIRKGLLETDEPIGRLLADNRLETRREITSVTQEPAADLADHFGIDGDAVLHARNYVIVSGGRPVMRISEKFPVTSFTSVDLAAEPRLLRSR